MQRRLALIVVTALAAVSAVAVVSAPPAQATDTTGFSVQVIHTVATIGPANTITHNIKTVTVACPAGTTPIAGGVSAPSDVLRFRDEVNFGDGASVVETFGNYDYTPQTVSAFASCAPTHWFHPTARVVSTFGQGVGDSIYAAGGYTSCPSGSIALSARVDWSNTSLVEPEWIDNSGPTTDLKGWFVDGHNEAGGQHLIVDLQCVAASDFVPGAFLVQTSWENTTNAYAAHSLSASCPAGMTLLNGGSYMTAAGGSVQVGGPDAYQSYPGYFAWYVSAQVSPLSTLHVSAWCVPNQAPTLTFLTAPPTYTANPVAQVSFAASDPDSAAGYPLSVTCSLDAGPSTACTSPWIATVPEGLHQLEVTLTTGDGRTVSDGRQWTYDHTAPTATMTAPTAAFSLTSPVHVGWTASDAGSGIALFDGRYQEASYNSAFGPWQHPAAWEHTTSVQSGITPGSTQCYSIQAFDQAGNSSNYSVPTCTAEPIDDAVLNASSGWTRASSATFWNGTYTTTVNKNATLTLTGVHLDRVGVLALTCPTCGQVALLVGSTQIGTINLHSATTQFQVIRALSKFTASKGTVTIKVISSGKTVSIDGLAVSQR